MFRSSSNLVDTGDDLANLIERASKEARLHHVVGQVLQGAVHRPASKHEPGFTSLDPPDPVTAATPPVPLAPGDYDPPPAEFIKPEPAPGHVGYVAFSSKGTFQSREYLKRLGGRWDPDRKRWLVPVRHADRAAAVIEQAVLGKLPGADPGYRSERGTELGCWVCGARYSPVEFRARPGAKVEDYYCGCASPGAPKGAQRFRR